jgi:phosphonate transport system substrate-binding protein
MCACDRIRELSIPRRRICLGAAGALVFASRAARAAADAQVRIGLTPVFLDDQVGFLAQWRRWLETKLGRGVEFVQRGNYREVVDLVRTGRLDFAWICGYPYVRYRRELTLVATPKWRGGPYYHSYIIVPAEDTGSASLLDLRGRVFAYSDPDSNSGCLFPRYQLTVHGENPSRFFARTFFTWAHRKVVEAVAAGLATGGAVDGYVWETLAELSPALTRGTRIIERSPPLGHPPFVARADIAPAELERFRSVLLGMAGDPTGEALLRRLSLEGFMATAPSLYDDIARMAQRVQPV